MASSAALECSYECRYTFITLNSVEVSAAGSAAAGSAGYMYVIRGRVGWVSGESDWVR